MNNLTATLCLTIAVLLGSAGVSWGADFQKGFAAYKSGDFATALREWTPLAEQGIAVAQSNLGLMYVKGEGVPQDYKTAVKWFSLAAKQGNANAINSLKIMEKRVAAKKEETKRKKKYNRSGKMGSEIWYEWNGCRANK